MQGASKAEQVFKAGEVAPVSGVYTVVHESHRQNHLATLFQGERFPACARCQGKVRFILSRMARLVSEDNDFKRGSGPEGSK
jgi:hypothetical protein